MKTCSRCTQSKPLDDFALHRKTKDGRQTWCRPCSSEATRAGRKRVENFDPPESKACTSCERNKPRSEWGLNKRAHDGLQMYCKACVRERARAKLYGLDAATYAAMLAEQDGHCACCGERRRLVVDHCHQTGRVRSLLCNSCNAAEGYVKTEARARALLAYIQQHATA